VAVAYVVALGVVDPLYVPTPAGPMLRSCVHEVPSGTELRQIHTPDGEDTGAMEALLPDGTSRILPKCDTSRHPMFQPRLHGGRRRTNGGKQPFAYDGWLEYTAINGNSSFDIFLGDMSVPQNPASPPEVLYIFTGLQNIDWIPVVDPDPTVPFDIIQPVLQYPADAGYHWSVKSWYVTLDTGTVASSEIPLKFGDIVFGNMTRTGPSTYFIGSTSRASGKTTSITVNHDRLVTQPWAYNTVECYGCTSCSTFPANSPCYFTDLAIQSGTQKVTPQWKVNPKPSRNHFCKENVVVQSPSTVTFTFN